jgi:hypothetical protein
MQVQVQGEGSVILEAIIGATAMQVVSGPPILSGAAIWPYSASL